ncbi:putative glycolipid-binding domain-containing protein [Nocardia sp. NPDC006044]|uniref:putative glycolipid-binding domain-containing protein n=1 Tax=Nocardia sp. NPDC006044 TaxID=3364306 RepID=UPI0036AB05C7
MIEKTEVLTGRQVLWQVQETAGFESSWIDLDGLRLRGTGRAVGQLPEPYWLTYTLDTDAEAVTERLQVTCVTATDHRQLDLRREDGVWTVDGEPRPDLADARDCDLACSPLTNTMPIIRTGLHRHPGTAEFLMAFVEVPTLRVVPSRQTYTHLSLAEDGSDIRYASGSFTSDLHIDEDGLVLVYPTLARRVPPKTTVTEGERQRGPGSARPDA